MNGDIQIELLGEFTNLNFFIKSMNRFVEELNLTFCDINDYKYAFTYDDLLSSSESQQPLVEIWYVFGDHEIDMTFKNFYNFDIFYKMIKILKEESSLNIDLDEDTEDITTLDEVAATVEDEEY